MTSVYPFSGNNVLKVLGLADKYQNVPVIKKGKTVLLSWLIDCKEKPPSFATSEQLQYTLAALKILKKSVEIGYDDIKTKP